MHVLLRVPIIIIRGRRSILVIIQIAVIKSVVVFIVDGFYDSNLDYDENAVIKSVVVLIVVFVNSKIIDYTRKGFSGLIYIIVVLL